MRTRLSSTMALDLPSSVASPQSLVDGSPTALTLSPRLHNNDLAPTKTEGRRWGRYSIFALWTNDVHNIANYSFAMGLYALGLNGWQILLSLGIGAALVFIFMNLSGYMGQRTGVPFPVISRISFGIHGAQIPALIRAVIAIAWFGIQTYLASVVLRVLLIAVHPGFAAYDHDSILGLSSLGWVSFVAIWFLQLAILAYGMEMVRRYEGFAGPVILLTVISLAAWMYFQANGTIAWSNREPLDTAEVWRIVAGNLWHADSEFQRLFPLLAMLQNNQDRQFLGFAGEYSGVRRDNGPAVRRAVSNQRADYRKPNTDHCLHSEHLLFSTRVSGVSNCDGGGEHHGQLRRSGLCAE